MNDPGFWREYAKAFLHLTGIVLWLVLVLAPLILGGIYVLHPLLVWLAGEYAVLVWFGLAIVLVMAAAALSMAHDKYHRRY